MVTRRCRLAPSQPCQLQTHCNMALCAFCAQLQEDFMNNCAVRTVLSAVMGGGMGVMFGVFMGTMDTVRTLQPRGWGVSAE